MEPVSAAWEVRQRLLTYLIDFGIDLVFACDIVTRIHIDLPDHLDATTIDTLLTLHTQKLEDMMQRVEQMAKPLFTRHSQLRHYAYATQTMINNLATQHQIILSSAKPPPLS